MTDQTPPSYPPQEEQSTPTAINPLALVPLELGKAISVCFDFTIKNFMLLFSIFAIVVIPLNLLAYAIIGDIASFTAKMQKIQFDLLQNMGNKVQLQPIMQQYAAIQAMSGKILLWSLLAGIFVMLATLAVQQGIIWITEKKTVNLLETYKKVAPKLLPYLIMSILFSIIFVLALMLFIIPGIYLALGWGFYSWVYLTEDKAFFDAFTRSKEIASGKRLTILGYYIVFGLLFGIMQAILGSILSLLPVVPVLSTLLVAVVSYGFQLFSIVFSAILFFSLKARKEQSGQQS